jgi:hypothetical protein
MGVIIENYTTQNGLIVPELYSFVKGIRIIKDLSGSTYTCSFHINAYMTYEGRLNGTNVVLLPQSFTLPTTNLPLETLLEKSIFLIAYDTLKERFTTAGYTCRDA